MLGKIILIVFLILFGLGKVYLDNERYEEITFRLKELEKLKELEDEWENGKKNQTSDR